MVFLVVFFGAMHGLFLLPVLLSLFGPGSCTSPEIEDDMKLSNIERSLPHPYCIPHPQFTLNGSNLGGAIKGSNIPSIERYNSKPFKSLQDMEKDLGLGTSEENSSESSIHSQKKPPLGESALNKRYRDAWRRNSEDNLNNIRPPQVLDIFGTESEEYYRQRPRVENANPRMYEPKEEPIRSRYQPKRKYSPPRRFDYYAPNGTHLVRSNSYHNVVHPAHQRFLKESRFP